MHSQALLRLLLNNSSLQDVYWIGGGSAAGKSTIARLIAAQNGFSVYATDDVMADHARRSTPENSPLLHRFMAMDMEYEWRLSAPNRTLAIHMDVGSSSGPKKFDATLVLVRRPITDANLARMLIVRPLMTARVIGAIYWQALRLYLKGAPLHPHPRTRPRGIAA